MWKNKRKVTKEEVWPGVEKSSLKKQDSLKKEIDKLQERQVEREKQRKGTKA